MTNNGSNQGKRQDVEMRSNRFQKWVRKTFVIRTSDGRQSLMPGIFWGAIAALVIVGVAIGSGWNPFSSSPSSSLDPLTDTPPGSSLEASRESTLDSSLGSTLDSSLNSAQSVTPVQFALELSPQQAPDLADATGDTVQQEDVATSSVSASRANVATETRDSVTPNGTLPAVPTPTQTRPVGDPALPAVSLSEMAWPVTGDIIRPFGWYRYPALSEWRYSHAVVLQPAAGVTDVRAALAGRVHDVVNEAGSWRLRIAHAGGLFTEYEGLSAVSVASYQIVETGQVIGHVDEVSTSGLRFTVLHGEEPIDPTQYLSAGVSPVTTR